MKKVTKNIYLQWYRDMTFWRRFEDKCRSLYLKQKIRGFLHLYNGQEAIPAGFLHAMNPETDKVITAYRCHVWPMAMGTDPKRVLAELMGKVTGTSQGLGGSMHIFDKEHHFYGGHGIVGGQIPLGAGIAFADKYHKRDGVTICCFGDGAARQGVLHETFNMAMNWKLPVVFVCENNGYAMGTSVDRTSNQHEIYKLGLAYNMPSAPVDGMDPVKVAEAAYEAIERARKGDGPTLLEIKTYRYRGHSMSDAEPYRTREEVDAHKDEDPILLIQHTLLSKKYATQKQLDAIVEEVKKEIEACEKFAEESDVPTLDFMYKYNYSQKDYPFIDQIDKI
ncbi:MAG: pyruvate dehydrogenase (acetyl-transferring) E1 component subunit alpha [Weeksellaceae bacterium]